MKNCRQGAICIMSCFLLLACSASPKFAEKNIHYSYSYDDNNHVSISYNINEKNIKEKNYIYPRENISIISSPYYEKAKTFNVNKLEYSDFTGNKNIYKHPFIERDVVMFFNGDSRNRGMGNNVVDIGIENSIKFYANNTLQTQHYIFLNEYTIRNIIYPYFKVFGFDYNTAKDFSVYHELMHGNVWQDWLEDNFANKKLAKEEAADLGALLYLINSKNLNDNESKKLFNAVILMRESLVNDHDHMTQDILKGFKVFYFSNKSEIKKINNFSIDKFVSLFIYNFKKEVYVNWDYPINLDFKSGV